MSKKKLIAGPDFLVTKILKNKITFNNIDEQYSKKMPYISPSVSTSLIYSRFSRIFQKKIKFFQTSPKINVL